MGLRRILSPRASRVYVFRYENPAWLMENGKPHFRTIRAVAGEGRGKLGSKAEAQALAERRLSEQFGYAAFEKETMIRQQVAGYLDGAAERLRQEPRLHQDNYVLVSVERVK